MKEELLYYDSRNPGKNTTKVKENTVWKICDIYAGNPSYKKRENYCLEKFCPKKCKRIENNNNRNTNERGYA